MSSHAQVFHNLRKFPQIYAASMGVVLVKMRMHSAMRLPIIRGEGEIPKGGIFPGNIVPWGDGVPGTPYMTPPFLCLVNTVWGSGY